MLVDPHDVASLGRGSSATGRDESGESEGCCRFRAPVGNPRSKASMMKKDNACRSSGRRFGARLAIILVKPEPLLTAALRKEAVVVKFNFKQHTEMPMPFQCTCTVSVDLHTKSPRPDDGRRCLPCKTGRGVGGALKNSPNDQWAQFFFFCARRWRALRAPI